jgi:hypothetical protein
VLIKAGVKIGDCQLPIAYAIGVAEGVYDAYGFGLVVTSIDDSKHGDKSKHYPGLAVDLRTRHLDSGSKAAIYKKLQDKLEWLGYDVVLEQDHFHVEYDPKQGENWIKETT